jgi:hypothetical protein
VSKQYIEEKDHFLQPQRRMFLLTGASLWRQWENKRGGAFPPGDCTAQTLRFETAELLHEV